MKIFVDTNIFLDLILKRENFHDALLLFNAVEKKLFSAVILTNDKSFYKADIETLSSSEFVKKYL